MPKTKISEFSATPGNNTDIDGINIAEGCAPSGINDAIRELMAQLKDFQAGTAGDSFNGPIGTTTPAAGVFTNLSASGTFALTGDQVQISEGGTGQTTANAAFNALAPSQSTHAGKYLKTDGTNTSWDAIEINTADITGTLPIANGGTGLTALGTGVQTALGQNVTGSGGIVLASSPSLTTPNLGTPSAVTLTNATGLPLSTGVTGTLATTNGGTGLTSFTANGVVYASSTSALTTGSALSFNGSDLTVANGDLTIATNGKKLYVNYIANNSGADLNINGAVNSIFAIASAEQMRLTSTGLGIGTSSPATKLDVNGDVTQRNGAGVIIGTITNNAGWYDFSGSTNVSGAQISTAAATPIRFLPNGTERARITSGGYFKASDAGTYVSSTGSYHEFRQTDASNQGVVLSCTNGSFTSIALQIRADRNTTNDTFYAIRYFNDGAGAYKFNVADSGNVTNTNGSYGTISDAKMKTDIVDAGSQWADIKAIRFRKFKMKDDPSGLVQLGVVAQELEQTSPGLVAEHKDVDGEGVDLGTTTKSVKTSILLMKAAVALQEAMARIEQLEAKVAALEAK